jgi:hypothetical protein
VKGSVCASVSSVARYRDRELRRYFCGDAAFSNPTINEYLEAERFSRAIRLPANDILSREIWHLLAKPVAKPSPASDSL